MTFELNPFKWYMEIAIHFNDLRRRAKKKRKNKQINKRKNDSVQICIRKPKLCRLIFEI